MEREELIEEIQHRKPQTIRCDRILVPTDGSGQAFRAVNEAIQLAAVTGAQLTLLMVVDLNKHVAAFEQVSLSGYVPAELKIAAYQFLSDLMHVIPSEIKARTRVEVGNPSEVICDVADEEQSNDIKHAYQNSKMPPVVKCIYDRWHLVVSHSIIEEYYRKLGRGKLCM
ncbi:MAG: universal stress protein [Mitsuokella jalaludinii]|nr:universal stress protein [Mitsuokella jalaludinii]